MATKNIISFTCDARKSIIEAMQKRGIKELLTVMSKEEWAKENNRILEELEEDDGDYKDYQDQESPYVTWFDKHLNGWNCRVDKVKLTTDSDGNPLLEYDCWLGEDGGISLNEHDIEYTTNNHVFLHLQELLGIEDEPEKVWVLHRECVIDYELSSREIKVFRNEEEARKEFKEKAKHDCKYCCISEWEVSSDDENNFVAYEDDYALNHIMIELNETVIN